ncbi:MAG: helix-turn-helix transcriptional regulator [Rhodococcus sp. (in: high G+C Gram-positive bacteria)]|uniref:helix-turn-helix transcriptional regulator n=1 Tax=Rhodococcus sp. TaxID=1831 RepID=UPI002ADAA680|nr:helix-turn-helix transcriptional regulator [Rhodococcus sp. (in: high G+C Gram-positive bacteria)]
MLLSADRELGTVPRSGVRGFRADRLRELRVRAGLSADDLAAKVGASRQAVSTWETGRSTPPPAALGRIADALHTSVSALVPIPESQLKLSDLRVHAALSQSDAAQRVGVSTTVLADIERGRKPETVERVKLLARAYGVTTETVAAAWRRTQEARSTRARNL